MGVDIKAYAGREQAYVKHYFLDSYLQSLVFKVASSYDHIVYVDGFSGPWQSGGENFNDTSFGIALNVLRSAKKKWRQINPNRTIRVTAHLVEKSKASFSELNKIPPKYPDIEVIPHRGDFVALAEELANSISKDAFAFLFIDPKGWKIDMQGISKLLGLPNCEVVFNFMFDFINRAASMKDPALVKSLDKLITAEEWREKLIAAVGEEKPNRGPILVDAFSTTLANVGGYKFAAAIPVLRPLKDRPLYYLVYATRKPPGIEVFRNCHIDTLQRQSKVRGATKLATSTSQTGQSEAFAFDEMNTTDVDKYLREEAAAAKAYLYEITPIAPENAAYGDIWPRVLTKHAIKKTELNKLAAAARQDKSIEFLNWEDRHRVPSDHYIMQRTRSSLFDI
ncbi:three-Cys-motif partner protein TcmP [Acidocella sp.]|uniref:three-Cys-motif partner protein TcmP n=1 Tax=Acidocella sp. TaxID=50710 RepID=UPI0026033DFC|nr:three-Cys-motif partner protein TcmP [Acidocella sp.]